MAKTKPTTRNAVAAARPGPTPAAAAAFAKLERERAALEPTDLATINVDIPQSVSIALGALQSIGELRNDVASSLPKHPIDAFDRLETYALGAWYAHLISLPPANAASAVGTLEEEATPLRENLLGDAEALARRGLLPEQAVKDIRAGQGQVDKANDLVALSALFLANWDAIANKTAATIEEVRRAGDLGPLFLAALGVREHGPAPTPSKAQEDRQRAFTLFVRAYDEVRRAVTYLRWHEGDADVVAPSLYKGRGGRGAAKSDGKEETAKTDAGAGSGSTVVTA